MPQTAIKSKRIITPEGMIDGFVVILDGEIEAVLTSLPDGDFDINDVSDQVVMAGIIDPHVHINEPGRTEWEGFDTATKAAMAGGITTLIEMPLNASPVTTTVEAFNKKINACFDIPIAIGISMTSRLHINCGFWGGVIPGNENEIEPLIEKGVFGFKAFLTHSGIDEFPNVSEADLRKAMPIIAKHNLPILVHCELESPIPNYQSPIPNSYSRYLNSRPQKWEDDAIALMIRLCEEFNCRTHIVHLSSASSIEQIRVAKQKRLPLTVETAQHYLYFNAEDIPDGRTEFKCAPPIREKENNELLWEALKNGIIDFVATDHSPAPPNLKEIESGDLVKAWGGISSIQFALPVLWTAAKKHDCKIEDISRWLCNNPSFLPGLEKSKGKIEKGFDADLVIWDPGKKFKVTADTTYHRHKISPYLGEELFGLVKQTWLKGEKIYDGGRFLDLNKGQLLLNHK